MSLDFTALENIPLQIAKKKAQNAFIWKHISV